MDDVKMTPEKFASLWCYSSVVPLSQAVKERDARIRAEARAEALRGASDKICEACIDEWGAQEPCPYRLNWTIDKCKIRNALCLADEPKEEL